MESHLFLSTLRKQFWLGLLTVTTKKVRHHLRSSVCISERFSEQNKRYVYLSFTNYVEGQDKGYYTVICGEHELNTKESHQVELKVTSVVAHPKWVTASQGYDIAVYKVKFIARVLI